MRAGGRGTSRSLQIVTGCSQDVTTEVAVADGDVVVLLEARRRPARHRRRPSQLGAGANGGLLQVLASDADDSTHVFEFRPRRHGTGARWPTPCAE